MAAREKIGKKKTARDCVMRIVQAMPPGVAIGRSPVLLRSSITAGNLHEALRVGREK